MPKRKPVNETSSGDPGDPGDRSTSRLSDRILNALTQQEIAQLLDALFSVLPLEVQDHAIAQLAEDTQQTIRQILAPTSIAESAQTSETQTVSLAKQAQTWSQLWQEWNECRSYH